MGVSLASVGMIAYHPTITYGGGGFVRRDLWPDLADKVVRRFHDRIAIDGQLRIPTDLNHVEIMGTIRYPSRQMVQLSGGIKYPTKQILPVKGRIDIKRLIATGVLNG